MIINSATTTCESAFPIPSGLPRLDVAMGGGIPRGRLTVLTGFSGVGKTATASFCSGSMCMKGFHVGYISYEDMESLEGRILSSTTGIPYARILKGKDAWSPSEQRKVREIIKRLTSKIKFLNRSQAVRKVSLQDSLFGDFHQLKSGFSQLDLVILDWINPYAAGARTREDCECPDNRVIEAAYCATAAFLDRFAQENKIAVLAIMQSNVSALSNKYNKPYYTCYSKLCSSYAKYFIGMSSNRNEDGLYNKDQYLSVYDGNTLRLKEHVPVRRDFDFQRYAVLE